MRSDGKQSARMQSFPGHLSLAAAFAAAFVRQTISFARWNSLYMSRTSFKDVRDARRRAGSGTEKAKRRRSLLASRFGGRVETGDESVDDYLASRGPVAAQEKWPEGEDKRGRRKKGGGKMQRGESGGEPRGVARSLEKGKRSGEETP